MNKNKIQIQTESVNESPENYAKMGMEGEENVEG